MPLTLAACHPECDDYFDMTKTVTKMVHHLMKEDEQEGDDATQGERHSQEEEGHSRCLCQSGRDGHDRLARGGTDLRKPHGGHLTPPFTLHITRTREGRPRNMWQQS